MDPCVKHLIFQVLVRYKICKQPILPPCYRLLGMYPETAPPPPTPSPMGSCVGQSRLRIAATSLNPSKVIRLIES